MVTTLGMLKKARQLIKSTIQLKGLRHVSYLFVEIGYSSSLFLLNQLNGPHLHQENPWRGRSLARFLNKGKSDDERKSWITYCNFLREHLHTYDYQPKISILMPVYRPNPTFLEEAIRSVSLQSYQNFELCIVDDASDSREIDQVLDSFKEELGEKIKCIKHETNQHISAATNSCFSLATGEYIVLLDHDDRLKPNALAEVVRALELYNRPDILYSDEEIIDDRGIVQGTVYKPGWSEFLHLTKNYTTHLSVYASTLVEKIGGWQLGTEGAQDHDFMLRAVEVTNSEVVHIPISLYQWRSHAASTAQDGQAKPYAAIAGAKAVEEACRRRGMDAEVDFEQRYFQYKISPKLPAQLPKISILILNKNSFDYISVCLHSIFAVTDYPNFEVIVMDNGSSDERCFQLYDECRQSHPEQFKQVSDPRYFNFARLNNDAAREAEGEYLVFLNSDTEVLHGDWLEGLLRFAQIDRVGAVGCKLYYGNGPIQHGGIYGAGRHVGGHSGRLLPPEADLPLAINNCLHECLGVTAACLMIRKEKFWSIGGFEEMHAPNGFGDVHFGISLLELGYVNLFTPYVTLKHHESVTRGKNIEMYERNFICSNFSQYVFMDKYYNLSFSYNDHYTVEENYRLPDLPNTWLDLPLYS